MRVDLPMCDLKYCRYCQDCNCVATDLQRERCEYLQLQELTDKEAKE